MIDALGHSVPVMALTATATPKVQSDIKDAGYDQSQYIQVIFQSNKSFYEIRPKINKAQTIKEIIQIFRTQPERPVLCMFNQESQQKSLPRHLGVNGIKAVTLSRRTGYQVKSQNQDDF